jgi:hypothetical protein
MAQASEGTNRDRRQLLSTAATGIAAAGVASLSGLHVASGAADAAIRPFRVNIAEEDLVDLRRRIAATRWPDRETVLDDSQGVPLAAIQQLARYWAREYDWRKCEARLNALPQFITEIDGLSIHFIHVRSKHDNALPLIVTHGWPGSIIEQLKIIEPLTKPTAHGADARDAFDVIIPSLPGYAFSGKPIGTGWDPEHIARVWAELMKRLGYGAMSLRAAIGARPFQAPWRAKRRQDCSASTSTCRQRCRQKWPRRSAAAPCRRDFPTRNAPS